MITKIKSRIKDVKRDSLGHKEVVLKNLENSLVEFSSQLEELREKYAKTLQVAYNPNDIINYPLDKSGIWRRKIMLVY
ncbi:MAG: hypothetical protein IPP04_00220 [Saprospiraceae bacterium]|nr:hypothetical protein [Saprospiraceae bacterium]